MTVDWREWRLGAALLALLAVFALKGLLIQPPSPPERVQVGAFDTGRALARLARVLGDQRPHPVDSAANDAVRERLMAELSALGLRPEVHEATDCSGFPKSRTVSCSHVRNVVATIPGPEAPALLINAHYDSTPTGPGAADDGIGVATMLEAAHHLRRERLARPVILLFNEGEEYGLNGAAAFVESDPLAGRVGKLINIEARGVSGPAFMFETDEPNGAAIADYRAASRRPFANSISTDFAKLIPNSTDVVMFKPRRWQTLSFAIVGNETRYHTPGDRIEALDRASLHHMGSEVLAASRRLAGPERAAGGQSIFTDVGGRLLIAMPLMAGAAMLALLVATALVLLVRDRAWRPAVGLLAATVAGIGVAAIISLLAGILRAGDYWRAYPWLTTLAVAATAIAVQGWLAARTASRHDRSQLRLAAWSLVLAVGAAASIVLPGAIIYFVLGPALALVGILLARRWPALGRALAWAGAILQLILFTELMAQIELTLIDGPTWAAAPLAALAALPILAETARGSTRWTLRLAAAAAVGLWAAALLAPRASAERPGAFSLDHVQDERSGKAVWAAATKQAPLPAAFDRFGPWRAGELPFNKRMRWLASAPPAAAPRAGVAVVQSTADGQGRRLRLRLERGGADALMLRFEEDVPVRAMGLSGKPRAIGADASEGPFVLRCSGRACDGLEVEVMIGGRSPVTAMMVSQRFAAPPQARPLQALRPADAHPQYSPDSTIRVHALRL